MSQLDRLQLTVDRLVAEAHEGLEGVNVSLSVARNRMLQWQLLGTPPPTHPALPMLTRSAAAPPPPPRPDAFVPTPTHPTHPTGPAVYNGFVWHSVSCALYEILGMNWLIYPSTTSDAGVVTTFPNPNYSDFGRPALAFRLSAILGTVGPFLCWLLTSYLLKRAGYLV